MPIFRPVLRPQLTNSYIASFAGHHDGSINRNSILSSISLHMSDALGLRSSSPQRLLSPITLLFGARVCIHIVLHRLEILLSHLHITVESGISLAADAI